MRLPRMLLLLLLALLSGLGLFFYYYNKKWELSHSPEEPIQWAFEPRFNHLGACQEGFCIGQQDYKKLYFVNYAGDTVVEFSGHRRALWGEGSVGLHFRHTEGFSSGLVPVRASIDYGRTMVFYVDKQAKIRIDRNFDEGFDFSEGLAAVAREMTWGFIDTSGNYVLQPNYWAASSFSEGLACVAVISDAFYDAEEPDEEGEEPSRKTPMLKWGAIDKKGEWRIPPQFDYIHRFSEGLAWAKLGEGWGVIDTLGNWKMKPYLERCNEEPFRNGLSLSTINRLDKCIYFLNAEGYSFFNKRFSEGQTFSEGLAAVKCDSTRLWGYINPQGELLIPAVFEKALPFLQGLAVVKKGELYGYINRKGELVLPYAFEEARAFNAEGVAPVRLNKKWGLLKKTLDSSF